ncbi:outer membrane protein assembly factor BamE [Deltaproteobacteria bacterium TL4]
MISLKKRITIAGLLVLLMASVVYNMVQYHYDVGSALTRTLLYFLEDTRWSPGFSEEVFAKIHVGMTEQEVLSLLGEPLRRNCLTICEWAYAWQKTGNDSFDRRSIILNQIGVVERVRHEFYVD